MSIGYGLHSGLLSGVKPSVLTRFSSGGVDASLDGILTAGDPMQALIDAMGFDTKPTYLVGGHEASGSTELGGTAAADLSNGTFPPTFSQADSRLGSDDTTLFDATNEHLSSSYSGWDVGTGSMAVIFINAFNSKAVSFPFYKVAGSRGYRMTTLPSGSILFSIETPTGSQAATVSADHGTANPHTMLCTRNVTSGVGTLVTRGGTGTIPSLNTDSADSAATFKIGNLNNSSLQNWGLFAIWKGAAAESITASHRTALAEWLGYE